MFSPIRPCLLIPTVSSHPDRVSLKVALHWHLLRASVESGGILDSSGQHDGSVIHVCIPFGEYLRCAALSIFTSSSTETSLQPSYERISPLTNGRGTIIWTMLPEREPKIAHSDSNSDLVDDDGDLNLEQSPAKCVTKSTSSWATCAPWSATKNRTSSPP